MGQVVTGLGEVSESGVRARGITHRERARTRRSVAPAAGRIAYAATFRGYGKIVIIDHGGGWTSLITGLGPSRVRVGDSVAQGAPIGRAVRATIPASPSNCAAAAEPVDMTPLIG